MLPIKKNDMVKVLSGRDKGKTGKVMHMYPKEGTALVQGINYVKKHVRRKKQDEQAGIVQKEAPISFAKLGVICKRCNTATRVKIELLADGTKTRHCKKCNESL
ncbi:MAG TPA: 50S ribosomal protein L24 [Candidatus Omnitrophota bacterium]|nr:50S ribosomal protein L24 [Candidatus Omnitrophota bacterium]